MSIPSRFLEEVPQPLVENLGGGTAAWSTPSYAGAYGSRFRARRAAAQNGEFEGRHYNYEDENQDTPRSFSSPGSGPKPSPKQGSTPASGNSIDNIARFFGGKVGAVKPSSMGRPVSERPKMDIPESNGAAGLKKGQRVRHVKYGEGTVLMREGDGEDAKLTVLFNQHGMKKLMEKFANLQKL